MALAPGTVPIETAMPAVATWLPSPVPSKPKEPWLLQILLGIFPAICYLGLILKSLPVLGTATLFYLATIFLHIKHVIKSPSPPEDRLEGLVEGDDPAVAPVRIRIYQNGTETGNDVGAAYLEEGAFVFAGRSCSFRIGGQDVLTAREWKERFGEIWHEDCGIPLRHPARQVWVSVHPMTGSAKNNLEFRRGVWAFTAHPYLASGNRQYPPLAVGPMVELSARASRAVEFGMAGIAVLASVIAGWAIGWAVGLTIFLAFGAAALGYLSIVRNRDTLTKIAQEEALANPPA